MANQLANPAALDLDIFCNDDWLTETDDFGDPNEEGPNGSEGKSKFQHSLMVDFNYSIAMLMSIPPFHINS